MQCKELQLYLLGVLKYLQTYCFYDEENNTFIIFRDVIFLESSKTYNAIERHHDFLDRLRHEKYSQEFENEIPHHDGGIPILDQSMEFYRKKSLPYMNLQPLMTL